MANPQADGVAERMLRSAAIAWVADRAEADWDVIRYTDLESVDLAGSSLRLKDRMRGIWRPSGWSAALSITTTYRPLGRDRPYSDELGLDGLLRYKWQGTDPQAADNVKLRNAMQARVPLIWFIGVDTGWYTAIAPVWIVAEEPDSHQFVVAVDEGQRALTPSDLSAPALRQYVERITKQRVHQRVFREQVLRAYDSHCSVCKLHHRQLLDAAHIIGDKEEGGEPVISNGLSLCKIHHAAYDTNILGIRPDYVVEVREDILVERDGPMLQHGLKERHGQRLLWVPSSRNRKPDPERLEARFAEFLAAA